VVFVDTSALYALLDRDDAHHREAAQVFAGLLRRRVPLHTHAYGVVESLALAQRRLGMEAARALVHDLLGVVRVAPVDEALHRAALTATLASGRRDVSLVGWASFLFMRHRKMEKAFAYDVHFFGQGLKPVQAEDHG